MSDVFKTDIPNRIFSASSITCYMSCPRKFKYRYLTKMIHEDENVNLVFGKCIHTGIAAFYTGSTMEEGIESAMAEWALAGITGSKTKNDIVLINTLSNYYKTYKRDIDSGDVLKVEVSFQVPVYEYEGQPVYLIGYLDQIRKDHSLYDTKSTSRPLTDYWFNTYVNSFQLLGYYYATVMTFGNCPRIMVDGIKVPAVKEDCFSRRSLPVSQNQVDEWVNTFIRVTAEIIEQENHWCNQTSCGDYSGCEYLPLCIYGENHPVAREMI